MPWDDKSKSGGPWGSGGSENGGSGGDKGSPWGRPNQGGENKGGSDLEEQMRRMQDKFRRRAGGGGGGNRRGGKGGGNPFGPLGFLVIGGIALLAWASTCFVIVDPSQQASIFRFGKFQTNFDSGLHFHWPAPIEEHVLVNVEKRNQTTIGNTRDESLMLTEDENIADIQFSVYWQVNPTSPQDFILNVKNPTDAVAQVSESVMREVVGKSKLQSVITTGRGAIQVEVAKQTQALLDDYQAGIIIREVQIDGAYPPEQVRKAFDDVTVAEQDAETNINQATQYANEIVPQARGTAQRILQEAEGYRDSVVATAQGEASRFDQIYSEYRKAPRVTRERMYLETMERVLQRTDKMILDQNSGAVPYLPLERTQRGN